MKPLQITTPGHLGIAVVDLLSLIEYALQIDAHLSILCLIEAVSEALTCLGDILLDLPIQLSDIVLHKDVCTISLFGVLIVDHRVIEGR